MSATLAILLMTCILGFTVISSVHASREKALESPDVADVWAKIIWNRFPEEFYPLFLSPLLRAGRIQEAQERSRVRNLSSEDVESYSGYITVNKDYDSTMFFWFFPAETNKSTAPVLLWLNGGPGRSSVFGALLENSPWEVNEEGTQVKRRAVSWTKNFSMLYIDNPVGVGYSFTRNTNGFSTNMQQVCENLYSVLIQFFKLFPQYSHQDFYVGGQSYAGKYVPALGYFIHERNVEPLTPQDQLINFKGIYVGAGYCDAENMMPVFPDYLYYSGLISNNQRLELKHRFVTIITEALSGRKNRTMIEYLGLFFTEPVVMFGVNPDHLLGSKATNAHLMDGLDKFMKSALARLKLHVGYAVVTDHMQWSREAANALSSDMLVNTSMQNAFLMDHYKVLHYSGNLDIIVNVPMTEAFLDHVQWTGQEEYRHSDRQKWIVDGDLAGWFTIVKNFTRVVVRNSGHMVPYDKPKSALEMMKNFIFNQPFQTVRDYNLV